TFRQRPPFPLSSTDLLVYSYLVKRDAYGSPVTQAGVSRATGYTRQTVAASLERLIASDFLVEGRPSVRPEAFLLNKSKEPGHWSKRLKFFKCFIPADGSPLSHDDIMVFSLLFKSGERPPSGWTIS